MVRITLSTDDGATFPTELATVANTGAATVVLPTIGSAAARLRLEPVGGVFFAVSRPFVIEVCTADVNQDGTIDSHDYGAFVDAFETGAPVAVADFNADGFIDFFDYVAYVEAFEAGC